MHKPASINAINICGTSKNIKKCLITQSCCTKPLNAINFLKNPTKLSVLSYEDPDDQADEDDEDFMWFKPGAQQRPNTRPANEDDPFSITVHGESPQ